MKGGAEVDSAAARDVHMNGEGAVDVDFRRNRQSHDAYSKRESIARALHVSLPSVFLLDPPCQKPDQIKPSGKTRTQPTPLHW